MFFAAIQTASPSSQTLSLNWFDIALAGILVFAFYRGRKRGMTKELFPTLNWLIVLFAASFGHPRLADWLQQQGYIKAIFGSSFEERTAALMTAYVSICVVVTLFFTTVTRDANTKLESSSFFGSNEYYWGIAASMIRYSCMVLVALALLNAPYYSQAYIQADKNYKNQVYGGGQKEYSGNLFPSPYDVQNEVFKDSFMGPLITANLSFLLIDSTGQASKYTHH